MISIVTSLDHRKYTIESTSIKTARVSPSFANQLISSDQAIHRMNQLGLQRRPFLFIINFEKNQSYISPSDEISSQEILYDFQGISNDSPTRNFKIRHFASTPIPFDQYIKSFDEIRTEIESGNTYLLNLTFETPINSTSSLRDIFLASHAKYKLYVENNFVIFSPESFIQTKNGKIYSYPMKGTIQADQPHAAKRILADPKEMAEHATIVDLIRNDLSMVASHVRVDKFRYIEKIETNNSPLLQVSSRISGQLPDNYRQHLGDILFKLLPAGSICGAPKNKTLEIISDTETHRRGFYTGVCGYFDGEDLDSGVMIRYIEQRGNHLFFKSGGGLTFMSDAEKEYREYIDKIYVPII